MDQPDMFLTNGVWGVQKDEIFVPGQKCVHTICLKNNSFKLAYEFNVDENKTE